MKPRHDHSFRNKRKKLGIKIDVSDSFRDPVLLAYIDFKGEFEDMSEEKFVSLAEKIKGAEGSEAMRYLQYRYIASAFTARSALESPGISEEDRLLWIGRLDALKQMVLPLQGNIISTAEEIKKRWKAEREKEAKTKKSEHS